MVLIFRRNTNPNLYRLAALQDYRVISTLPVEVRRINTSDLELPVTEEETELLHNNILVKRICDRYFLCISREVNCQATEVDTFCRNDVNSLCFVLEFNPLYLAFTGTVPELNDTPCIL